MQFCSRVGAKFTYVLLITKMGSNYHFSNSSEDEDDFYSTNSYYEERISSLDKRVGLKRSPRRRKEEHAFKTDETETADYCSFSEEETSYSKVVCESNSKSIDAPIEEIITDKSNRRRRTRAGVSRSELNHMIAFVFSPYEKKEVRKFENIYYIGNHSSNRSHLTGTNFGYDDVKGFYKVVKYDHLFYRYECLKSLGKGSFGEVIKAFDHKLNISVAIKITRNSEGAAFAAEKEIRILRLIAERDVNDDMNLVHLKKVFFFRNHTCLVLELLDASLSELLRRDFYAVRAISAPIYTASIFQGLLALEELNIMHGDIKPHNLLKRFHNCSLKICDYGHSEIIDSETMFTSPCRQTLWYKAPEVILALPYSTPIDMWSTGCVIAEMYTGRPLLRGNNSEEQLALIVELLGLPPIEMVSNSPRRDRFFDQAGRPRWLRDSLHLAGSSNPGSKRIGLPSSRKISTIIIDKDVANLVESCLKWKPEERITPREALQHVSLRHLVKELRRCCITS